MNKKKLLALFLALGFTCNAVASEEEKKPVAVSEEVANADEQNAASEEENHEIEENYEEASE